MRRKKLRFQYCTALFATTLLVGTNCVVATASELENIETRAPAFSEDEAATAVNDTEKLNVPESIVSDREDIIDELPIEPEYTPPDSGRPDEDTSVYSD
ncbi:MAG: hypothetical protein K2L86_03070 [Lachnospiraceae bacterium]|nr:hypothetical protein [Lachnospiraceae bacterium]